MTLHCEIAKQKRVSKEEKSCRKTLKHTNQHNKCHYLWSLHFTDVADTCTITSEMKFFIPSRCSAGNAFHLYLITPSRTCIYNRIMVRKWITCLIPNNVASMDT